MEESTASCHVAVKLSAALVRRGYLIRYSKYESDPPPHVYIDFEYSSKVNSVTCVMNLTYDVSARKATVRRQDTLRCETW
jgi:hypothetical protein